MEREDDSDDKQYDATPRKLEQAREKGDIARSADVTTAAVYGGFLAAALVGGGESLARAGSVLAQFMARAPEIAAGGAALAYVGDALAELGLALVPLFAFPLLFAVLSITAQRGWVFAPVKLEPQLSRISLISNAAQKFGRGGLFEFAKSTTKLLILSLCLGLFLSDQLPSALMAIALEPAGVSMEMLRQVVAFTTIVLIVVSAIGAIDFLWQMAEHGRKNRMSRKELTDETKGTQGDPHIRMQRRQRGYDIATNRMMADVPTADVVIVNPTHYAVALRWDRTPGRAPVCVAKGTDAVAARIRTLAAEAGVPIRRDPPCARALYASVAIGQEIEPAQYRAVAAAIRFAEAMRKRAGSRAAR